MRIKLFSLEKMLENGCFFMTMPGRNGEDYRALYFDPEGKIKTEEQYEALDEEEMIDFQMSSFECFYEEELSFLPYNTETEVRNEDRIWIYIPGGKDHIMIPKLPGVVYEEC
ncbi:MAG: hypothetical protein ACRCXT_00420 [Paraclostridium sp.]|uniref:hypothetical protein n=1 Tax=Cetobacterium sp. TaxID=2071632 RepID=UPI003F3DC5D2